MRTPAGTECRHYYEDFHRGRQQQQCRLILANPRSLPWSEKTCGKCEVPQILRANGSPNLQLTLTRTKRLGLFDRLEVRASCREHGDSVPDPYTGCAACAAELRRSLEVRE